MQRTEKSKQKSIVKYSTVEKKYKEIENGDALVPEFWCQIDCEPL